LIDSIFVSWALTLIFGATGLMLAVNQSAHAPTTVSERLSRGLHVAGGAAMILMSWSWGSNLPAWPQEAVFTLAAGWFFVRAVHGQPAHRRTGGSRWHDLHHAVMAGTLSWSIIAMSPPHPWYSSSGSDFN
jgi:hypothetical protein